MSSSYRDRQRSPPRRDRSRSCERARDRRDDDDSSRRRVERRDDFGRDVYSDRDATGRRDDRRDQPRRRNVSRSRSRERQPQASSSFSSGANRVPEEKASVAQLIAAKNQAKQERLAMVQSLVSGTQEIKKTKVKTEDDAQADEEDDEAMLEIMGFAGFNSTKGKPVEENVFGPASGAAAKGKARKYRQYMNRKGGFNRPLQKMD